MHGEPGKSTRVADVQDVRGVGTHTLQQGGGRGGAAVWEEGTHKQRPRVSSYIKYD